MNVPNPTQGDISIAIQICHMGGTIMEYIPYYNEQRATRHRYDMHGMKDFLSDLSNKPTIPEAENEARRDIMNFAYPKEEHSPEWRGAKKKINTRK
jgi:CCR4-NOT transcriptional regulation complex NOT5 subunit